jgi:hypothetical protein
LARWCVYSRDFSDHLALMLGDARALACRGNLADITESELKFTGEQLGQLVRQTLGPALRGARRRIALVVRGPVQYGVARQFQAITEAFCEVEIFTDAPVAREWILRP